MPFPPTPQPSPRVGLYLGGLRHDVLEYSSAGLTLPSAVLDTIEIASLRRGEPCPATLQVHGEMYGVTLRLAAHGPLHAEFSFVSLAAQARGALEHYATHQAEPEPEAELATATGAELPGPMALAFARLAEPVVPGGRRLVLAESEEVYALTLERKHLALDEEPSVEAPKKALVPKPAATRPLLNSQLVFVCGTTLFALLALLLMWSLA